MSVQHAQLASTARRQRRLESAQCCLPGRSLPRHRALFFVSHLAPSTLVVSTWARHSAGLLLVGSCWLARQACILETARVVPSRASTRVPVHASPRLSCRTRSTLGSLQGAKPPCFSFGTQPHGASPCLWQKRPLPPHYLFRRNMGPDGFGCEGILKRSSILALCVCLPDPPDSPAKLFANFDCLTTSTLRRPAHEVGLVQPSWRRRKKAMLC